MNSPEKTVAVACDHRGLEMKREIINYLKTQGYSVEDFGCHSAQSSDYPDSMIPAAECIKSNKCTRAIGICYTGIGSSIVANKVCGVRASLVKNVEEAKLTRAHNDSNMLILGAGFLDSNLTIPIVKAWLETPFEGGRHAERVNKIKSYEKQHCK